MKKILINRKPVTGPWGGGNNFVKALHEYAPSHGYIPVNSLQPDIDLLFMIDPRYDELGISINEMVDYKLKNNNARLVYRINECDKRKGLTNDIDPLIKIAGQYIDMGIFISNWIKDYHVDSEWKCKINPVIYSGTDKRYFCNKNKMDNGKINIVTHHWSDNFMKGQDIYEMLDEWIGSNPDYTFTYIGRTKAKFLNTNIVPAMFGKQLANKLSAYNVYISGSRFDPGPNHIIESLACNIPTYAIEESGGAVEMVGRDHVYSDFNDLQSILLRKNYESNKGLVPVDWKTCIANYFKQIEKVMQ